MTLSWHASHGCHELRGADRPYRIVKAGDHYLADAWRTQRSQFVVIALTLTAAKAACEKDARPPRIQS
jgi:hypothetical protein